MREYEFLFVGGSCGSFLKTIFYYYLYKHGRYPHPVKLTVHPVTGDCHGVGQSTPNYHEPTDIEIIKQVNPTAKIVLISYEPDDLNLIIKMQYEKVFKKWLYRNKDAAEQTWPELKGRMATPEEQENSVKAVLASGYSTWLSKIDSCEVDKIIKFKTIIGQSDEDLNQIITEYIQLDRLTEVEEFIKQYRLINQKYFNGNS